MESYGTMMALSTQEEEMVVKPSAGFKKDTKWKSFKEGTIAYLNGIKGKYNIPLAYIIRENEVPVPNQAYQSEHHHLIEVTPLVGIESEEDNGHVFDLLKSWTINGPAWTWMRAYNSIQDGRRAWLASVNHFEGDARSKTESRIRHMQQLQLLSITARRNISRLRCMSLFVRMGMLTWNYMGKLFQKKNESKTY